MIDYISPNPLVDSADYVETMKGVREKLNPKNGYYCMEIHYSADPDKNNDEFRNEVRKGISEKKFQQEYEINWESVTAQVVWPEYDSLVHFRNTKFESKYPLFVTNDAGVWSCFLFSQLTDYGQLRFLGLDMNMAELKAEPHIQKAVQFMNLNYPEPKSIDLIADIACRKTESTVEYNWETLLKQHFNRTPHQYAMQGKNDGAIDLVGASLLQWVINPETGRQEPKIIFSNEFDLFHQTLKAGYRYKEQRDLAQPKSVQIDEVHPFEDIADCIKYTVYHIFAEHKAEQRRDERKKQHRGMNFVPRFNK